MRRFWLTFRARCDDVPEGRAAVFTVGEFVTVEVDVEEPDVERLAASKAFFRGDAPGVRIRGAGNIHSARNIHEYDASPRWLKD